jgi:pimeloyl-ACP methyl ester carboxylesterase
VQAAAKPPAERTDHREVAVWRGGAPEGEVDVWFLHAFGDSHETFGGAFSSRLAQGARILALDLPGHGESPPRKSGLAVEQAAQAWRDAIGALSSSRSVVLVGHSMAAIIATEAARLLDRMPELVISIEGNLVPADAYFSGQAARFDQPDLFHHHFHGQMARLAARDTSLRGFAENVRRADPASLWTLGRSVAARQTPGLDFVGLACPTAYYWDAASVGEEARDFLARHRPHQRRLDGLGHWPMLKGPERFYGAIADDLRQLGLS